MVTEPRRLYRSRSDRVIGGVCGGLAQFFTIDATIIRLLFVFAALFGGTSLLVYLVMFLVVPEEPLPKDDVISVTSVESQTAEKTKKE
jgi:phage shock protein PspC (stress-responsive transcriptional regulator)